MASNFLGYERLNKKISLNAKREKPIMELDLRVEGFNLDIMDIYDWHMNFPYYTGKGYRALKVEDYHYFSENSQFGTGFRQARGGSIRAFHENIQQMHQLVKTHLMPLLKEVKEAHFYKKWFDKIVNNDKIVQDLLRKGAKEDNLELKKARGERNEAINHIKDKWVVDVDGSKMWMAQRSQNEQGLDFALTPQIFFGVNLDNPLIELHNEGKTLKEQLDEDIYSVDITQTAKENISRYLFRFHTWLPTAIKDTDISFRLRVSTLKQYYAQLQMYINFMKPLLLEISKKSEHFNSENFYKDFEMENPDFVNLFDTSFSFVKILGIRNLDVRGPNRLTDLEFSPYGLFLRTGTEIIGDVDKKIGFIKNEIGNKYEFYPCNNKNISMKDFKKIKPILISKTDLKPFKVMEIDFSQNRRNEVIQTQQGPQQVPYNKNKIYYRAYCWNIYEIATYRESLKEDNIDLLETFISEIKVVKEDLLYYVNDLENFDLENNENKPIKDEKDLKSKYDYSLLLGPFQGLAEILSPLIPKFNFKKNKKNTSKDTSEIYYITKLEVLEDTWKLYTVGKKVHGYIQY